MVLCLVGMLVVSAQGQVPGPAPGYNPSDFISYLALGADRAPCASGTGRSYYSQNCMASPSATPYTRSCVQITRCARG